MKSLTSQLKIGKFHSKSNLTSQKNLGNIFRILNKVQEKFGIEKIENLKTNHFEKVFQDLKDKGLSNSTLSGYATAARMIAESIGKQNIFPRDNKDMGISRAGERLQPQECNIEKQQDIRGNLYDRAQFLGLAHDMRKEFGLRAKESLLSNKISVHADGKQYLVVDGSKGGRPREVEIKNDGQREIISKVQQYIKENGLKSIIPKELNLKQAYDLQKNSLKEFGATRHDGSNAHALRHEWAQKEIANGENRTKVAEELGHGRTDVISHYVR
ncbi:MAG: hypothetical protein EOM12_04965 [Verrucomicrobiae bacterium]|nr:hypothetical protein [Verrucomicrobiae bacterium]